MMAEEQPRGDPKAFAATEWSGKLDAWKAPSPLLLILLAVGKNEWEASFQCRRDSIMREIVRESPEASELDVPLALLDASSSGPF